MTEDTFHDEIMSEDSQKEVKTQSDHEEAQRGPSEIIHTRGTARDEAAESTDTHSAEDDRSSPADTVRKDKDDGDSSNRSISLHIHKLH